MSTRGLTDLGDRIVGLELPVDGTSQDSIAAAEHVFVTLRAKLSRWIGADAFDTLLDRALERARSDHPILAQTRWRPAPKPQFTGFAATGSGSQPAEVRAAISSVIDALTAHLGRFIGDDLATRLVLEHWDTPPPPGGERGES